MIQYFILKQSSSINNQIPAQKRCGNDKKIGFCNGLLNTANVSYDCYLYIVDVNFICKLWGLFPYLTMTNIKKEEYS